VWGLDVVSLDESGTSAFTFVIDGPRGRGTGTLSPIAVLGQPGPPLALSWTVASPPVAGLVALIVLAWRRVRPGRQPLLA
jgi:hypothetical protein